MTTTTIFILCLIQFQVLNLVNREIMPLPLRLISELPLKMSENAGPVPNTQGPQQTFA